MNNSIDDFSEDVEEILNAPPSGLMIWGTAGIVVALFLMVFVGWMYKFPEKVIEDFYLTTEKEPESLPAPFRTKVAEYFVEEGQTVIEGSPLLYLDDAAKLEHIDSLESEINQLSIGQIEFSDYEIPLRLQLGEVFPDFNNFITKLEIYRNVRKTNREKINSKVFVDRRDKNHNNINSLMAKIEDAEDDLIKLEKSWRDATKELAAVDTTKRSSWEIITENKNKLRKDKRREIEALNQYLKDAYQEGQDIIFDGYIRDLDAESDENRVFRELIQALSNLQNAIFNWKKKHILKAHISGKVTFYGVPEEDGFFKLNNPILAIIPTQDEGKYIGHVKLPVQKLSKIEEGDSVMLKFNRYPFLEFGGVKGLVDKKMTSHDPDFYDVKISLPNGLKTSLNQQLDFQHRMTGDAEIIVEDKRFITRLLEGFIAIFKKDEKMETNSKG